MKFEWYVGLFMNGKLVDSSPSAMIKSEALDLAQLARSKSKLDYRVIHQNDLNK